MSDPILRLAPYAESCVFSKQSPVPGFCDHPQLAPSVAPLLPRLRGQFAEFLNDSSPAHLSLLSQSTCVGFGYGRYEFSLEAFPGSLASIPSRPSLNTPIQVSPLNRGISLPVQASPLDRHPSAGVPSFLRHSIVVTNSSRDRISNLLSISYAFRPDLRPRLTLGGSTFPRNPWTSGECDSHTLRVTHAGILSCMQSTNPSGSTSPHIQRSPTDSTP